MEEISIKEVIETLLKGKLVIILTTLAALVLGAAVYLFYPSEYETTTSILANPIVDRYESDVANSFALPSMDIFTYKQQFLNNYTVQQTIEALDIRNREGRYLTFEEFTKNITVENPVDTNILEVTVKGREPEEVVQIADTLSRYFIRYITDVYQASASVSAKALEAQLKTEEANLDREAARLRDYLANSESMESLNSEIQSLITQLTQYKSHLNDLERSIEADSLSVAQLRERAGTDIAAGEMQLDAVVTGRAAYTGEYQFDISTATGGLSETLYTLRLTDVEARLIENTNVRSAVTKKINELQNRLSDLQTKQAEEQYKYNTIQRDLQRAESIYNTYTAQHRQALIVEAANLGNVNIKVISEAILPVDPSNKSLLIIGGAAGVLGVFIGVFAVLFKGYWEAEETQAETEPARHEQEAETEAAL